MDKVKLPRDIADNINELRKQGYLNVEIITETKIGTHPSWNTLVKFVGVSVNNYDLLLQALVNGYTVEETPEDTVKNYYEFCTERMMTAKDSKEYDTFFGERVGIRNTLIFLKIKIAGVNHD